MTLVNSTSLFEFNKNADISSWKVVDDGVMGGRSAGTFNLSPEGYGVFQGFVSLENNGGFSSVRYPFDPVQVKKGSIVVLKLKGDGKDYQFRVKDQTGRYYSYITTFSTSGEWEEIKISLKDMYPSFRGMKLDMPNFSESSIEELAFLIANKRAEKFKLLIQSIRVE